MGEGAVIVRRGSDGELFLRRSGDIDRAKRIGRRVPTPHFNMVVAPAESGRMKLAVVIGRKFGPATVRNRAKRRIRELARAVEARLTPHYHVVIFPKSPVLKMQFVELTMVWQSILRREGLLRE